MDSKMGTMEMIKKTDSQTGHWSGFVKHLDRIVYKSELPFYPEYIQDEEHHHHEEKREQKPVPVQAKEQKRSAPEPKTSMAKMLGGLKIEE